MSKRKKRASTVGVAERRAALAIVSPINSRILGWQLEAIRLRAIGQSRRDSGPSHLLNDVELLASQVVLQIGELSAVLDAPEAPIETGRVQDTLRALESLKVNIDQARRALDAR